MHKLGIRSELKISVFMGVDNARSVLWLLMGARLLAGEVSARGGLRASLGIGA